MTEVINIIRMKDHKPNKRPLDSLGRDQTSLTSKTKGDAKCHFEFAFLMQYPYCSVLYALVHVKFFFTLYDYNRQLGNVLIL